jgi:hypothetical protein
MCLSITRNEALERCKFMQGALILGSGASCANADKKQRAAFYDNHRRSLARSRARARTPSECVRYVFYA